MVVRFGLGGLPTTVNIMAVNDLNCIMNPSLLTVEMFAQLVVFMFDV